MLGAEDSEVFLSHPNPVHARSYKKDAHPFEAQRLAVNYWARLLPARWSTKYLP